MATELVRTALQNVLVLSEILSHVHDIRDLAQCVRVDRLWHSVGIRYLWQGTPTLGHQVPCSVTMGALRALSHDVDRFRHYSRYIKALNLENEWSYASGTRTFEDYAREFRELMRAELWEGSPLSALELFCAVACPEIDLIDGVISLPIVWPNLRMLTVSHERVPIKFLAALEGISLGWLEFTIDIPETEDDTLRQFIATQQGLVGLDITADRGEPWAYQATYATIFNLPKLKHFRTNLQLIDASFLGNEEAQLHSLDILSDSFNTIWSSSLSSLSSLRMIALIGMATVERTLPILAETLRRLSSLTMLEDVEIRHHLLTEGDLGTSLQAFANSNTGLSHFDIQKGGADSDVSFSIDDILNFAKVAPKLESFECDYPISGSSTDLIAGMAQSIPGLRRIALSEMPFDILSLKSLSAVSIQSHLESVFLGSLRISYDDLTETEVVELLDIMQNSFSSLRDVHIGIYVPSWMKQIVAQWNQDLQKRPKRPYVDIYEEMLHGLHLEALSPYRPHTLVKNDTTSLA